MTQLEQAKARVARAHQQYLDACGNLADLVASEELKAKQRIEAVRAKMAEQVKALQTAADAKTEAINAQVNEIKSPEVRKALVTIADQTRKELGLAPKGLAA